MKHAYLIMAHYRYDILKKTIEALDDENNDFFIHIDKKSKTMPKLSARKSRIVYIKRIKVNWGGYSQIQCTLNLLEAAFNSPVKYTYFHFLHGASYPIKSKKYIYDFFNKYYPKEFVGFDIENELSDNVYNRIKYIHIFNEIGKKNNTFNWRLKNKLDTMFVKVQQHLKINRFKKLKLKIKKGTAYFSIEREFTNYLISNKNIIKKIFRYSITSDEIYVQTLLYNSSFYKNVFDSKNEYRGAMCVSCWPKAVNNEIRENNQFIFKDLNLLKKREELFALKFDGPDGLKLINELQKYNNMI